MFFFILIVVFERKVFAKLAKFSTNALYESNQPSILNVQCSLFDILQDHAFNGQHYDIRSARFFEFFHHCPEFIQGNHSMNSYHIVIR